MKLINCSTKRIEEFVQDIPAYAILSHTWEADELTFAMLLQGGPSEAVTKRQGWQKIEWSSSQALSDGLQYVWVDTVCIDKTSSVELSEAINSMYTYYREARICYVYLFDVCSRRTSALPGPLQPCPPERLVRFENSRWFTRGWTLQELIAPSKMVFFDHHWKKITTKEDSLTLLSSITGIDEFILAGGYLRFVSIARIFSWAARRQTTRKEDVAYSLLGLFGISMPMLYGEGDSAFVRLQKMLIETYDDQSIFAWKILPGTRVWDGVLAPSPQNFLDSGNIVPASALSELEEPLGRAKPVSLTSRGVFFHASAFEHTYNDVSQRWEGVLQLHCVDINNNTLEEPPELVSINVAFTDESCRYCVRSYHARLPTGRKKRAPGTRDVYALVSGNLLAATPYRYSGHRVHICMLPTWPLGHVYTRVNPATYSSRIEQQEEPNYTLSFEDCAFIVYRSAMASAANNRFNSIEDTTHHIVIYVTALRKPTTSILQPAVSQFFVAVRTFVGMAAVRESIKLRGTDLTKDEMSHAVQYKQSGLQINARIFSAHMDGSTCLSIFANEAPTLPFRGASLDKIGHGGIPFSYSRAEDRLLLRKEIQRLVENIMPHGDKKGEESEAVGHYARLESPT